jgi:hypothetical protein
MSLNRTNTMTAMMTKPHPLVAEWRQEAELYERRGLTSHAAMARSFADELEAHQEEYELELLTIAQAAEESGYTPPHVRRLVEEGRIPNAGEGYAPRVRRCDLPKKPSPRPITDGPDLAGEVLSRMKK